MRIINQSNFNLQERKKEFLDALPFPYLIVDNFLESDFFHQLKLSIDSKPDDVEGRKFETDVENEKWISLNSTLPEMTKMIVNALNSNEWLEQMKVLTGIDSLITTEAGNTKLANFHIMGPNAYLGPHVDHSYEPEKGFPHVLNIILFLTKDWDEKYGGSTLLFDKYGKEVISKANYKENRAVIFLHTPYSFHGVERISSEAKDKRYSIYVDYYSESFEPYEHMSLNFDKKWFKHATTFKLKSYMDYLKPKNFRYVKALTLYQLNRLGMNL